MRGITCICDCWCEAIWVGATGEAGGLMGTCGCAAGGTNTPLQVFWREGWGAVKKAAAVKLLVQIQTFHNCSMSFRCSGSNLDNGFGMNLLQLTNCNASSEAKAVCRARPKLGLPCMVLYCPKTCWFLMLLLKAPSCAWLLPSPLPNSCSSC